jgi:Tfp pilus assembly protein PilF
MDGFANPLKSRVFAIICVSGVGIVAQPGCSSMSSHGSGLLGLKNKSDATSSAVGQVQSDQFGRPLPGSKVPLPPPIAEEKPEVSDETRSHVAMAMGEMLESVGNLPAAQAQYEQVLRIDPKSLNGSLALARVYARQGRPDAALKVYQTAEKHHRRSAALFNDKGLLLADQKDWTASIAAIRTAVKLEPSESKYHNNLGMILASSGNYEEAYKEFREAVGPGPAHFNVALMLLQADRPVEARDHLERALAAMPSLRKAQELLQQLDVSTSTTSLASNEREVEVELDASTEDEEQISDQELRTADNKEMLKVDAIENETVEQAAAESSEPATVEAPASNSTESNRNPWSRRWVPPKWLR